mgnify:CR=1 FL=1
MHIIIVVEGDEEKLKAFSQYIKPILLEYFDWVDRVDEDIERRTVRSTGNVLENIINTMTLDQHKKLANDYIKPEKMIYLILMVLLKKERH